MRFIYRCIGCCLLLPMAVAAAPFSLSVYPQGSDEPVAHMPLSAEGEWCLHWQHSVAEFLVRDCFRVDAQGQMLLHESHQPDFAAGLDYIQGRGELTSDGEGGYIIQNIDEPVVANRLRLRVGSLRVDHRIVTAQQSVSLSEQVPGQSVEIRLMDNNNNSVHGSNE